MEFTDNSRFMERVEVLFTMAVLADSPRKEFGKRGLTATPRLESSGGRIPHDVNEPGRPLPLPPPLECRKRRSLGCFHAP